MSDAPVEEKKPTKDATFWKVLNSAIELDFKKGHLKWTMTDLARKSGITRSLIYYYFGRSKIEILREAVRMVGEEVVGLGEDRVQLWRQGRFKDSLLLAREINNKAPHICSFILAHRGKPTEIGDMLHDVESQFLKKIRQFFPAKEEGQVRAIYGIYFGASFSPLVDEAAIDHIIGCLKSYFFDSH